MEENFLAKIDEILESISGLKIRLDRPENAYESSQQQINDLNNKLVNRCDKFENDLQKRVKVSDFKELQEKLDKIQTKQREDYNLLEQWFSTFFKSRTPKLSYLLLRTPYKLTQIDTILELLLKVM